MNATQHDMIEKLYMEMFDMLSAFAISIIKDESLAEEAVQETFRIACQKSEQLCESENPKGWLVNTLKFTLRNIKRNQESGQQLIARYLALETVAVTFSTDKVRLEVLYKNVADTEEFKLIKEMAVDGRSHLEMATDRGISVNACKKRVQRAKEFLQRKIKK